jgi:hypothetical protein
VNNYGSASNVTNFTTNITPALQSSSYKLPSTSSFIPYDATNNANINTPSMATDAATLKDTAAKTSASSSFAWFSGSGGKVSSNEKTLQSNEYKPPALDTYAPPVMPITNNRDFGNDSSYSAKVPLSIPPTQQSNYVYQPQQPMTKSVLSIEEQIRQTQEEIARLSTKTSTASFNNNNNNNNISNNNFYQTQSTANNFTHQIPAVSYNSSSLQPQQSLNYAHSNNSNNVSNILPISNTTYAQPINANISAGGGNSLYGNTFATPPLQSTQQYNNNNNSNNNAYGSNFNSNNSTTTNLASQFGSTSNSYNNNNNLNNSNNFGIFNQNNSSSFPTSNTNMNYSNSNINNVNQQVNLNQQQSNASLVSNFYGASLSRNNGSNNNNLNNNANIGNLPATTGYKPPLIPLSTTTNNNSTFPNNNLQPKNSNNNISNAFDFLN